MALTTASNLKTLQGRSFLTDYTAYKTELVEVGKIAYQTLATHLGSPPSDVDMERPLVTALQSTALFNNLCAAKPHASPMHYPAFAEALARYLLDNDWSDISAP